MSKDEKLSRLERELFELQLQWDHLSFDVTPEGGYFELDDEEKTLVIDQFCHVNVALTSVKKQIKRLQ